MKRKAKVPPTEPKEPQFDNVVLQVSRPARVVEYCRIDDPRADIFFVNQKGEKYAAQRPIANVFSVEIRSAHRMKGACREMLHWETWEQPLGTKPVIPANALFIAKAFELAETHNVPA